MSAETCVGIVTTVSHRTAFVSGDYDDDYDDDDDDDVDDDDTTRGSVWQCSIAPQIKLVKS